MPLALIGFSLQGFPPGNSISLSSSLITHSTIVSFLHPHVPACARTNSRVTPSRRLVRPNEHEGLRVLIRSQVRSHPALVLPSAGGRCPLGIVWPPRGCHQLILCLTAILSCASIEPVNGYTCALQSFGNQPTRASSEEEVHPFQALYPPRTTESKCFV